MREIEYKRIHAPLSDADRKMLFEKCYLCGSNQNLTVEHVAPKVLFSSFDTQKPILSEKRRVTTYLKLAACSPCNAIKGRDDEYVARQLQSTSFSEESEGTAGRLLSAFVKGKKGILRDIAANAQMINLKTPGGLHLGKVPALKINVPRVTRFMEKIAKGVIVANTARHYDWSEYNLSVVFNQALHCREFVRSDDFKLIIRNSPYREVWRGVFAYSAVYEENRGAMIMCFYNSHIAIAEFSKKIS